ncbi:MAG TPA: ubiquitin-like domain-containing protein [Pseudogracilibacillus sp.]|nr:ubiquitin-like domain-containing protein [Pseudogracilibacillus sp.]
MQKLLKPFSAFKTKTGYTVFAGIMVVLFSSWMVFDQAKTEVVFAADGDEETIKTDRETVGELLADLGVDVSDYDELSHGENEAIVDGMEIRFEKANKVLLTIDGDTEEYHSTAVTVGQFFEDEDLDFSRYDDISHSDIELLDYDMEIEVETSLPVTLVDGGDKEKIHTTEDTVKDLLKEQDVDYKKSDKIEPGLDTDLKEDMEINVIHVEKKEETEKETLSYDTVEKEDDSLLKGKEKVKEEGQKGKVVKTFEVTFENGEEVDREKIDEDVKKESKDEVVAIGTKEKKKEKAPKKPDSSKSSSDSSDDSKSSDSSSSSDSKDDDEKSEEPSGESMTMEATGYGPDCTGCSGVSATGMDLTDGGKVIAVDPSVIPLGSKVWVEGYGEAVAGDTGGDIKGDRIDVLMDSESKASSDWGRRSVEVKVLD